MLKIGLDISEKEYRELPYPSYSTLSNIKDNGRKALSGIKEDISEIDPIIIGSIVDKVITEDRYPENMVIINKKPSGKPLKIIKSLVERNDLIDPINVLSAKNKDIILQELDNEEYYKTSTDKMRLSKLTAYKIYANSLKDKDAYIVSSYQYNEADKIINALLLKYPWLKTKRANIIPQVKLIGKINGTEVKGMLDFVYIDEENNRIVPFDLKTGMKAHNNFFQGGYLDYNYYIQASMYSELLAQNINTHKIDNFRFMYCGRADLLPIIYEVNDESLQLGMTGFKYDNKYYPGVHELLDEYNYYIEYPNGKYNYGYDQDIVEIDVSK